jgi:hypothetical protein
MSARTCAFSAASNASPNSFIIALLRAFILSGRFSTISPTDFSTTMSIAMKKRYLKRRPVRKPAIKKLG